MGILNFGKKKKEEQIKKANAQYMVPRDIEIIQDCIRIIQKTKVPDVFFSRYALLIEKAKDLIINSKYVNLNISPEEALNEVIKNKQQAVHDFLIRYWADTSSKVDKLKTDSAKQNRVKKFFDSLDEYKEEMNAENIDYYITKYKSYSK